MAEEPTIVYSVKELIGRLDAKVDTILNVLTSKADRSDVAALEHTVNDVKEKVSGLETRERERDGQQASRTLSKRWVIGIWVAILGSLLSAGISLSIALTHK